VDRNELMTNLGLIYLASGIKNLTKLREIHLHFSACPNIQSHSLYYLKKQLKGIKDVFVYFDQWKWSSQDVEEVDPQEEKASMALQTLQNVVLEGRSLIDMLPGNYRNY